MKKLLSGFLAFLMILTILASCAQSGTDTQAETTPAVTDPTTGGDDKTTGGCGSVVALSMMACIIPAAVVICKKKRD